MQTFSLGFRVDARMNWLWGLLGNEKHVIGNWKKGNSCYKVTENWKIFSLSMLQEVIKHAWKRTRSFWMDYHLIKRLHIRFYEYWHCQFELQRMEDSSWWNKEKLVGILRSCRTRPWSYATVNTCYFSRRGKNDLRVTQRSQGHCLPFSVSSNLVLWPFSELCNFLLKGGKDTLNKRNCAE